jgi:hypothetical protein
VIYVTDQNGGKITASEQVETLRAFLQQNLTRPNEPSEGHAQPLH